MKPSQVLAFSPRELCIWGCKANLIICCSACAGRHWRVKHEMHGGAVGPYPPLSP